MGDYRFLQFISAGLLGLGLSTSVFAHPAAPNATYSLKNADGSEVTVKFHGDEHYRYATTEDGFVVVQDSGSYRYVNNDGSVSREIARNSHQRSERQKNFLKGMRPDEAKTAHKKLSKIRYPEGLELGVSSRHASNYDSGNLTGADNSSVTKQNAPAVRKRASAEPWVVGERWIPVLLMGSTDKAYADSAEVYALLNQEGYNKDGNIGSLRDYYLYSSNGKFNPHFVVFPVNVGKKLTDYTYQGEDYYGNYGNRFNEGKFIADAIDIVSARADFKSMGAKFCDKGTAVDGFIALFPGKEEDALNISEDFWGHQYWMQYNGAGSTWNKGYAKNGYTFDAYLFIAQKADNMYGGEKKMNIMGIYAHEFNHVLGLADHYNVSTGKGGPTPYDVMTQGMYNGKGNTPPVFSGFEMETMGWLTLKELSPNDTVSLKALSQGEAYSVSNPNQTDEYYVIEYRPSEKYDSYIGQNGVFIWYIDYDYNAFEVDNNPNGNESHLRVDMAAVIDRAGGKAENFKYVNKSGVAKVSGIYSTVMEGTDRACFTTGSGLSISKCPEEVIVSSSSVTVELSSSSVAVLPVSSSSIAPVELSSSSSGEVAIGNRTRVSSFAMDISSGILNLQVNAAGIKTVRIFDMQGSLVGMQNFEGSGTSINVGTMLSGGGYVVRINRGAQLLGSRKIVIP